MSSELVKSGESLPEFRGLQPRTFSEIMEFADVLSKSTIVPEAYRGQPANILLAMQMGSEVGLSPMQSLTNVYIIDGKPSLSTDAMLAVAKSSVHWDPAGFDVKYEGTGDNRKCIVTVQRKGEKAQRGEFVTSTARAAGKMSNPKSNWSLYPDDMLRARAMGRALKMAFPAEIKGFKSREEAEDSVIETDAVPVRQSLDSRIDATPVAPLATPAPAVVQVVVSEALDDTGLTKEEKLSALDKLAHANAVEKGTEYAEELAALLRYETGKPDKPVFEVASLDYFREGDAKENAKRVKLLYLIYKKACLIS